MKLGFPEPTFLVMDSITEPVTSGSELEEGEIDDGENNEIEIISERIVRGPMVPCVRVSAAVGSPARKRNEREDGIVDIKSKKRKPSCEILPELPSRLQELALQERITKPLRPASRSEQLTDKSHQSRNQYKNSPTNRRHTDFKKKQKNSPKGQNKNNGYRIPNSPRLTGAEKNQAHEKKPPPKTVVPEAKIKKVENDQEDDTDEEMELRLAALQSVVVKSSRPEEASDNTPSLPLDTEESKKVESEEDEDEELLRAQLLIEVAKKQTKDMEMEARVETVTPSSNATVAKDSSRQPVATAATSAALPAKRKFNQHIPIPKTDRLVINLRDDSSDSSDEDEGVEDSISAFIRSARQSVDQKTSDARNAVSALPLHEQEEYIRLKGEIERRANKALAATAQKSREKSPSDARTGTTSAPVVQKPLEELPQTAPTCSAAATAVVIPITEDDLSTVAGSPKPVDVRSTPIVQPECSEPKEVEVIKVDSPRGGRQSKTPEIPVAAEAEKSKDVVITNSALPTNVASQASASLSTKPSVPVKSAGSVTLKPKASAESLHAKHVAALKQQLLKKKNATKDALKSQLELVDKNRALLERSSQEVVRLKAMLQTAEEAERQLKLQLNNSQSQLQQLNKKMLSLERDLTALHNGVSPPKAKRLNQKLRAKAVHTAMSVMNSSLNHSSQLRVKPTIVTKALAKKPIAPANREKAANPSSRATNRPVAELSDAIKSVQHGEKRTVNKAGAHEDWLYGTLGDASYPTPEDNYPAWSANEHFSRKFSKLTVNPWKILCKSSLGAKGCQDKSCSFQHLPQDDSTLSPADPSV